MRDTLEAHCESLRELMRDAEQSGCSADEARVMRSIYYGALAHVARADRLLTDALHQQMNAAARAAREVA
jgi:hypothetical protein